MQAGIDGTVRGSCVACLRGTDSAIAVVGTEEWLAHMLTLLGLSDEEALNMAKGAWLSQDSQLVATNVVKVCESCAMQGGFEVKVSPRPLNGYVEPGLDKLSDS